MSDMKVRKCFVVGDEIKKIDEIDENDKPDFVELTDGQLLGMFKDLAKVNDDCDVAEQPLESEYNFHEIYDAEWYAERFPGFTPAEYWYMANAAEKENNVLVEIAEMRVEDMETLD